MPFSNRMRAVKSLRQSEPRASWKAVASVTSLPAMYLIRSTAWQTSFQMVVRGGFGKPTMSLWNSPTARVGPPASSTRRMASLVTSAKRRWNPTAHTTPLATAASRIACDSSGLAPAGFSMKTFLPAFMQSIAIGAMYSLAHDDVHDVRIYGVDHLAVVTEGPRDPVLVDDLAHPGLVELGDRLDARVFEPADVRVVGRLRPTACAYECCFQHDRLL